MTPLPHHCHPDNVQDGVSSYRIALVASDIVRLIDHVTGSAPGCGRAKLLVGHDWCAHTSA